MLVGYSERVEKLAHTSSEGKAPLWCFFEGTIGLRPNADSAKLSFAERLLYVTLNQDRIACFRPTLKHSVVAC